MFINFNLKAIKDGLALLAVAAIVGAIVSFIAQIFIVSVKSIYKFFLTTKIFKLL